MLSDGRHAGPGGRAAVLGVLAEGDAPFYAVTETGNERGKGKLTRRRSTTPWAFQGRSRDVWSSFPRKLWTNWGQMKTGYRLAAGGEWALRNLDLERFTSKVCQSRPGIFPLLNLCTSFQEKTLTRCLAFIPTLAERVLAAGTFCTKPVAPLASESQN